MYYSSLSSLPLLQGIGADVLLDWQERHVMRIVSVEKDEGVVIGQGEYCRTLSMLMEGEMECSMTADDWKLTERIYAGQVILERYSGVKSGRVSIISLSLSGAKMFLIATPRGK